MAVELYQNNAITSLTNPITTTSTSIIAVAAGGGFPTSLATGQQFRIAIDNELMVVISMSGGGTTFIVQRGAEGTTAATHLNGAAVYGVLTAVSKAATQYPSTAPTILADTAGNLYYSGGSLLADSTSELYYSTGVILTDSSGNLHYATGTDLADASGNLYIPHQLFDSTTSAGSAGMFLATTGTGVQWQIVVAQVPLYTWQQFGW